MLAIIALATVIFQVGSHLTQAAGALPVPVARVARRHVIQQGTASWHAPKHGSADARTASGRRWVSHELVAAHKTLPLGTMITVENLRNRRRVVVQVTDRGPYRGGRVLDLSQGAAETLGMCEQGTAPVRLTVLPPSVDERTAGVMAAVRDGG